MFTIKKRKGYWCFMAGVVCDNEVMVTVMLYTIAELQNTMCCKKLLDINHIHLLF